MYIFKAKIKLIYVTVPPFPRPYVIIVVGKYSEGRDYPKTRIYRKYKCIGIRYKCYLDNQPFLDMHHRGVHMWYMICGNRVWDISYLRWINQLPICPNSNEGPRYLKHNKSPNMFPSASHTSWLSAGDSWSWFKSGTLFFLKYFIWIV